MKIIRRPGERCQLFLCIQDAFPVSLASRFTDANFGIFVHRGPYSVPAWSPKGTYSEWYQYWLETKLLCGNREFSGPEFYDFHTKPYGPGFTYYHPFTNHR